MNRCPICKSWSFIVAKKWVTRHDLGRAGWHEKGECLDCGHKTDVLNIRPVRKTVPDGFVTTGNRFNSVSPLWRHEEAKIKELARRSITGDRALLTRLKTA